MNRFLLKYMFVLFVGLFFISCNTDNVTSKRDIRNSPDDISFSQRAYPNSFIDHSSVLASRKQFQKIKRSSETRKFGIWESEGPTNIGGRVTDIARHPVNPEIFYMGTSVGGVWKTIDGGENWIPIFDDVISPSVGNLAISKSNPNTLYVGTGEANGSGTSGAFVGTGIYRSDDAGLTWSHAGLENSNHIGRLYVDHNDPNIVYAAATGKLYGKDNDRGLYKTENGGSSWEQLFFVSDSTACIDLAVHPSDPNFIYSVMWERLRYPWIRDYGGVTSAIHRTKDGGITWERLDNGLPTNLESRGRMGIAISQSNPNNVFAVVTTNEITNQFEGIYQSEDGGDSWENINGDIFDVNPRPFSSFGWFFGNVRVNPQDDSNLLIMGLQTFITNSGGEEWQQSQGMHVDNHCMEFFDGDPKDILIGNDGGLYRSKDGGETFTFISNIAITQLYNIEVDYQLPERIFAGAQDNNTLGTFTGAKNDYVPLLGGDGFHVNVDPRNSDIIYAEYQWGNLFKSIDGGESFADISEEIDKSRTNWNTPVVLSPIDPSIVYYGSYKLFKSVEGENWTKISGDLSKGEHESGSTSFGTITTIAPSYNDIKTIYVGTDDGELSITRDGGNSWTSINENIPNRYITEVAVNPNNDAEAIVTLSGYRYLDYEPHVMLTQDYGENWMDITSNLPDVPVNDIEYHHQNDNIIFVGTDFGIWTSSDKGLTWELFADGMPVTIVTDLKIHPPTNTLFAGTFGRSIFSVDIEDDVSAITMLEIDKLNIFPNPASSQGDINIEMPKDLTNGNLIIINGLGKVVENRNITNNVKITGLETGIYIVRITNDKKAFQSKLIIQD